MKKLWKTVAFLGTAAAFAAAGLYLFRRFFGADEELEDFEDDDDDYLDEDDNFYEVTCPSCGETTYMDENTLLEGSISCPKCGEELEFDYSDLDDSDDDSSDSDDDEDKE